jgi:uncharacterized metal-binding protein YceD (DUF177 family)
MSDKVNPHTPYFKSYDLGALSEQGAEIVLTPGKDECAAIARWLDIPKVESLSARIRLSRRGGDLYDYDASFEADVVQACVVTLEPVPAHLAGTFHRTFQVEAATRRRKAAPTDDGEVAFTEADEAEVLTDPVADLAVPVLEEVSLALDPYPRAPGAKFEAPKDMEPARESPFAVLKALKEKPPAKG